MRYLVILVLVIALGSCDHCRDVDCLIGTKFYLRVVDDNNNDVTSDMTKLDFRFSNGGAAHLENVAPGIGAAYLPSSAEENYKITFDGKTSNVLVRSKSGAATECCGAQHEIDKIDTTKGRAQPESNASVPDDVVYVVHL